MSVANFDKIMTTCLEDLLSSVHSYWSLATLIETLDTAPDVLTTEIKLSMSHALTGLQHLVVMGLCRLDDEGKGKACLRNAAAEIKVSDGVRYTQLMTKIKVFRKSLESLKTQHRNAYIAHTLSKVDFENLPAIPSLYTHVVDAVEIYESFSGSPADLLITLPSGWSIDLRAWLITYGNLHKI